MKKILSLLSVILMTFGCYDDSDIRALLADHESRLSKLETLCSQMNTNIAALQTAVSALEKNVYVTAVTPVKEGSEVVGYAIAFNNSESITIYHGKDGQNGTPGKDGADGVTPVIGVKQDTDGVYYWTLNGEWLFDSAGNKVKASGTDGKDGAAGDKGDKGSDGVTPKLKIEDGYWYVSYDGQNWDPAGKATGDSANLVSVTQDAENVYLTLMDGVVITLPKGAASENPQNSAVDLSVSGTANCYVVSEAGLYKFKTVKGNRSTSVGIVASAEVLWETFGTDVKPSVGDLVKSAEYQDGYIAFQTADTFKEGNAVIAAKDASGNILWSWHIWMTDEPQGQVYYNNAGTMMDRNLGATSATPGDVGALGLLYQWGRKDPFLGSSSIHYDDMELAKSTITWPSAVVSDSSNGTTEYATAHPTTFITYNSSNYDWYYTGDSSTDNTRWTTSEAAKSIYDPCPAGWRVPDGGSSGVWSKALNSSSSYTGTYDSTNEGVNFSGKLGDAATIWLPASGCRSYYVGGLYDVGNFGYYWSASPFSRGAYYLYFCYNGRVYPSYDGNRAYGQSVRCLQE